jgi:hypothetical protein
LSDKRSSKILTLEEICFFKITLVYLESFFEPSWIKFLPGDSQMKKNMNDIDRGLRLVGGLFLSSLAFWGPKQKAFLGFLIPVATAFTGNCPAYSAFNLSTRKRVFKDLGERERLSDSELAAGHPIVGVS